MSINRELLGHGDWSLYRCVMRIPVEMNEAYVGGNQQFPTLWISLGTSKLKDLDRRPQPLPRMISKSKEAYTEN